MQYKFLLSPWRNEFIDAIGKARKELFISSPFVNLEGVRMLSKSIRTKEHINLSLVTNLTTQHIINGFTEPRALLELYKQFNQVNIASLGRLHAKVYLIDDSVGIITSANLTSGGLINNFEYGVLIDSRETISTIKDDMLKYFSLGNILDKQFLDKINVEASKVDRIKNKTENLAKNTQLSALLRKSTAVIEEELLKNRIKEGKTINAIFSDTIIYTLTRKGPLSTAGLHPLIQLMHPDICDDSIDRIINGQRFGKRWKHLVRDAQQTLKKRGLIYLKGGKWHLTP